VCEALMQRGRPVRLIAPRSTELCDSPLPVTYLPAPRRWTSLIYEPATVVWLLLAVRRSEAGVLYARHSPLLVAPTIVARLSGIPLVLEINGRTLDESEQVEPRLSSRIMLRTGILERLERRAVRTAKDCIVVSPGIAEYLASRHGVSGTHVHVVRNGVDLDRFTSMEPRVARELLGLDPTLTYIGWVGGLWSWQGLEFVIAAMVRLVRKRSDVRLLIVGRGEEQESLERLVRDEGIHGRVVFTGSVDPSRVPLYISAMEICIHYPKRARAGGSSPFKMYEYLAAGRPVIAGDDVGLRDEFGECVRYCQPEDADALAVAVEDLLQNPGEMAAMSDNARGFVRSGHSWSEVAMQIDTIIDEATGTP
jgi:phosphatidyl-myo-inositol dimannoside synthase